MPTWQNQLPSVQKHMGFDILRTPESSTIQAIVTCDDILVCDTHFWHGRTTPCERPDCPTCNESIPFRTHVYVSAFDAKARNHFIFECTAHAGKAFADYRAANGTLRGCAFFANRPKGKKNSKVCISTSPVNLQKILLPSPPDLIKALSVIWRLPNSGVYVEEKNHRPPTVKTHTGPINRMREQPNNMPEPPTVGEILGGNGDGIPVAATVK